MVEVSSQPHEQVPAAQVSRRVMRATGALMLIQVFLKAFGLIEKMVLSRLFGTGWRADAYNAAKDIAFYLYQLVDQVVMHSFLPVFVLRLREHGEKDAWRLASTAINLLILAMATIAVLGIHFTHSLLGVFQQGWMSEDIIRDPSLIPVTESLLRVMLVAVIFLATSSLTYCLLNSYKQFALPASADLVLKGTVLVLAVMLADSWGPMALAVGFVFGAAAKVTVHSVGLGKRLAEYRPVLDVRHPGMRQFGLLALPLLCGVGFSIVRQVMDNRFISSLAQGNLSAIKYARTITDMPVQFFPFMFGIALFPFLADIAVAGDMTRLRNMLMTATRMMILIFVPLAVLFILTQTPIVYILFASKQFDTESAGLMSGPFQIYAVGMLVGALEIIVLQFYFAMSDTLRPTIVGMAIVPLHILLAYMGVYNWKLGAMAIALALLCSKGTKIIILYAMIRRKFDSLEGGRTLLLAGKVLLACIPLVAILLYGREYLPQTVHAVGMMKKLTTLAGLTALGGLGLFVYGAVLHELRTEEIEMLVERARGKLLKKRAAA